MATTMLAILGGGCVRFVSFVAYLLSIVGFLTHSFASYRFLLTLSSLIELETHAL